MGRRLLTAHCNWAFISHFNLGLISLNNKWDSWQDHTSFKLILWQFGMSLYYFTSGALSINLEIICLECSEKIFCIDAISYLCRLGRKEIRKWEFFYISIYIYKNVHSHFGVSLTSFFFFLVWYFFCPYIN